MRLGVCVNMLASPEDPVGAAYLPVLHRLGYDYVELPLAQVMDLPGDAFSALLEPPERKLQQFLSCQPAADGGARGPHAGNCFLPGAVPVARVADGG